MDFNRSMAAGDFITADSAASSYLATDVISAEAKSDEMSLQPYLMKAEALRNLGEFKGALQLLDRSEEVVNGLKTAGGGRRLLQGMLQIGVGDAADTYRGRTFEKVMVNAQKADIFLELGDLENSRVEFKRADDRIRRAVSEFSAEIAAQQKKFNTELAANPDASDSQNAAAISQVNAQFPEIAQWQSYSDFVNPIVTYMHGLFFLVHGQDASDLSDAISSFERVAGMVPESTSLLSDLELAKQIQGGRETAKQEHVWIIQEDGIGPYLQQKDIKIPISRNGLNIPVIVALPELKMVEHTGGVLSASANGKRVELQTVSSFDRVVQTEFKKRWPMTVARALLSAAIRAVGNAKMAEKGTVGEVLGTAFNQALSRANTKIWVGLPKFWNMTRIPRPADGILRMQLDGVELPPFTLPSAKYAVVHLRTNGSLLTRAPSLLTTSPSVNLAQR